MGLVVLFALLLVLGGAGWWFGVKVPAERREIERAEVAERTTQQARESREAMFGPRALNADVEFRSSGLGFRIIEPGIGRHPAATDTVRITYRGTLRDGRVFDEAAEPVDFRLGALVPGMVAGLQMIRPGGEIEIFVPPSLGYGNRAVGAVPAGSGLIFDVTLIAIDP